LKRLILFLSILLPIGVALFLKYFGKNEYKLPVYYESGYPEILDCRATGPKLVYDYFAYENSLPVKIMAWFPECDDNTIFFNEQIARIHENLTKFNFVQYLMIRKDSLGLSFESKIDIAKCGLLIDKQDERNLQDWQCNGFFVLVDREFRIRGYYSGADFEDIDRLILEIHVMKTMIDDEQKK